MHRCSPPPCSARRKPKLVVIGGGPGGGTVARYVNKEPQGRDRRHADRAEKKFTTCFFSNIYVGGYRSFQSITHSYDKVRREGVKIVHEAAASIDRDKREVVLVGGKRIPYDRLVVAPGIDIKFDSVPGYSEAAAADHAACLEARRADRASGQEAQCAEGRRHHRDDRAAQSLSLPARTLRARLDVRPCAQAEGPQEVEDHRARSQAHLLQAGAVPGGVGEALSGHDRVAGPEDARRHQGRRCRRPAR